jgi:hypothetical protein
MVAMVPRSSGAETTVPLGGGHAPGASACGNRGASAQRVAPLTPAGIQAGPIVARVDAAVFFPYGGPVMSRPISEHSALPDALPDGLPAEYAEAYRSGYARARSGAEPALPDARRPLVDPESTHPMPRQALADPESTLAMPRQALADPESTHPMPRVTPEVDQRQSAPSAPRGESGPRRGRHASLLGSLGLTGLKPLWVLLLALVLVAGAFVAGRALSEDGLFGARAAEPGAAVGATAGGESVESAPAAYDGPVGTVPITGVESTCRSKDSVDAAGNPVSYAPAYAFDADLTTAWRCDGPASGQRLSFDVPEGTRVAELGLVPGYAKTDPANGVDRYAENNRITRVRWILGGGRSHVQELTGDPDDRSLRTLRIPATATTSVTLEVLASEPGPRNTIAVSEIRLGAATG